MYMKPILQIMSIENGVATSVKSQTLSP
ncbi:hypothetical protein F383_23094 [Gossypium arboreum]|uniref:Uncharacterized protein n=1 Tax=Gossypium arboreum TaxID=29729 RepID=A0A0B0NV59_GOSAR|nr:hypothetical protein F383_23094 [Gossypium arboreum]